MFAWKVGIYIPPQGQKLPCTLSYVCFLQSHMPHLQLHYYLQLQHAASIKRFVAFFDKRWRHAQKNTQARSVPHYSAAIKRCVLQDSPVS